MAWCRYRFYSSSVDDPRPIIFPPPGPYWVSGETGDGDYAILLAYLPPEIDLSQFWPEATMVEATTVEAISYTSRFPKPDWYTEP